MPSANPLKRALVEGKKQVGFWLSAMSPVCTEISAGAGFDWLLIDMEHTGNEVGDVAHALRAAVGGTAEPVVRVPWNDHVMVKRLLDQGTRSLLFPYIESAEEAREAVAATRYPPHGVRGYAGTTRATNYGRRKDYSKTVHDEICVLLQVESPTALAAIPEIGAIDGVDGIFIGPNDLAANSGFLGNAAAPEMKAAILEGLKRIKATGKAAGTLNYREDEAKTLFDAGFQFIAVGGDVGALAREADRIAKAFK
ncbi:MAG TPA: aldolase/citrate lyase family protein [Magnetospirillaceae bacterium]|jgi:4-hydroxy-2-oxoheptanedioate aldolase